MPLSTNLCTRQDVKDYLDLTVADDDALIDRLLPAASRYVERATHRFFGNEVGTTRLFRGNGLRHIELRPDLYAITDLSLAAYEGQAVTTVAPANYFLTSADGDPPLEGWPFERIDLAYNAPYVVFANGHATVSVTGNWGWATIPEDVKEGTCAYVAELLKARKAGPGGTVGSPDVGLVRIGKYVPMQTREMIAAFRRLGFAATGMTG